MKITLEFDDTDEAQVAIDGDKWRSFAFEYDQKLRGMAKWEGSDAADTFRTLFLEMLHERGLNLG